LASRTCTAAVATPFPSLCCPSAPVGPRLQAKKAALAHARQNAYAAADELEAKQAAAQEAAIKMQKAAAQNAKLKTFMTSVKASNTALAKLASDMKVLHKQVDTITKHTAEVKASTGKLRTKRNELQRKADDAARRADRRREMGLSIPGGGGGNAKAGIAQLETDVAGLRERLACLKRRTVQDAASKPRGPVKPAVEECGGKPAGGAAAGAKPAAAASAASAAATAASSSAADAITAAALGGDADADAAAPPAPADAAHVGVGASVWFDPDTGSIVDDKYPGPKVRGRIVTMIQKE